MKFHWKIVAGLLGLVISAAAWVKTGVSSGNIISSILKFFRFVSKFYSEVNSKFFKSSFNNTNGQYAGLVSETPGFSKNKSYQSLFLCKSKRVQAHESWLKSGVFSSLLLYRSLFLWVLFLFAFAGLVNAQTQTFNNPANNGLPANTFTVPPGVTQVTVQSWGGGGSSGQNTDGRARGGGGGGAYTGGTLTVVPGSTINVVVGAGGIYSATATATDDGGTSSAGVIVANGGSRGVIGNNGVANNGGLGGVASANPGGVTGFISFAGGKGGNGYVGADNGGGGGGGESASFTGVGNAGGNGTSGGAGGTGGVGNANGGDGGRGADNDGTPDSSNGNSSGGGGGGRADDNGNDRNGAAGQVILTWSCPVDAGTLSGASNICISGGTTTFTSTVLGGTWSSSNAAVATINPSTGLVTAQALGGGGTVTMTYTVASVGCTTRTNTKNVTVDLLPTVNAGGAMAAICQGGTTSALGGSIGGGATGGSWSTPAGGTFNPSAVTLNATWAPPAGYTGTATLTLTTTGGTCTAASANKTVTVNASTPAVPGAITGTTAQCPSLAGQTYSIPVVPNATTYTWTVPVGWTITAGAGTTSITVTTGTAGQNGNITVTAGNTCGNSSASSLAVTVNPGTPAVPGAITGTAAQCPSVSGQIYSITAVPNATTYTWTVPTGWMITAGAGANSITVTTGTAGQNGNITVTAGNSCGTSTASSLAVTVNPGTPAVPGAITGTTAQCPSLAVQIYSITAVPNATTYTWTVPTGWTITAGAGTNSITVTTGTAGQNGNITVTAGNSCGTSTASSLAVTVNPGTPAVPGAITGTAAQCPSLAVQIYSITAVPNATTYTWTVPTGWTITAGAGTNSITVTTGTAGQNGNITVTAGNSCGTSIASSLAVTVNPGTPAVPGAITGATPQCPSLAGQTYSITAVPNATTYTWAVPVGWSITAGAGSTSITVTTGTAGQNGNITVTAVNSCGISAASTKVVTVNPGTPAVPGAITGTTPQCPSLAGQTYSITAVSNATTYTWTVPAGWSITAGSGTNSITVTTGTAGQNGNITVTAGNSCGTSAASSLAVTFNPGTPTVPGSISGTTPQCPSMAGQVYNITAVPNATTYTWTVPTGWTITSGAGSTSITVTTGTAGQNGNITVTAGNTCGSSAASSMAVTVNPTIGTTNFTSGATNVCQDDPDQTYSATAANSTSISYSVSPSPAAGIINAVTGVMNWDAAFSGTATLTATSTGLCGTTSENRSVIVTPKVGSPSGITGSTSNVPPSTSGLIYSILAVPNATNYSWTLPVGWSITAGTGTNTIVVKSGLAGQNGDIKVIAGNSCFTSSESLLTVEVDPALIIVSQPVSQTECFGNTVTFSVGISGGTAPITYAWLRKKQSESSFTNISGDPDITFSADGSTMFVANVGNSSNPDLTEYKVTVTDQFLISATSVNVTLNVNPTSVGGSISADATVCSGVNTGTLNLIGKTGNVVKWQSSTDNFATNIVDISNTTTYQTYLNLTQSTSYRAVVQSGVCLVAITAPVTIRVLGGTLSPATQNVCQLNSSSPITLTGSFDQILRWEKSGDGGTTWIAISKTTNPMTDDFDSDGTFLVRAVISNTDGSVVCYSGTTQVIVDKRPTISGWGGQTVICQGQTINNLLSSPGSVTRWEYKYSETQPSDWQTLSWIPIAGNNQNTYSPTPTLAGYYKYHVIASNGSCIDVPSINATAEILVNPAPQVNPTSNQSLCNGSATAAIAFTTINTVGTTSFTWTNDQPSVGLAASGTGNIAAFTATNSGNSTVTATISVTPHLTNGGITCDGAIQTFTITVYPTPIVVATPASQAICSGLAPNVVLSSVVPGTTFSWTVVEAGVSGASAGSGAIINQPLTNTGLVNGTAIYTITPRANNCDGTPISVTITVYPTPTVTSTPVDATYCNGTLVSAYPLTGSPTGVVFDISGGLTVGLTDRTGVSAIPLFITNIASNVTVTATITITPRANGCSGTPATYTITVNPVPNVSVTPIKQTICSGGTTNIALGSNVAGSLLSWTTDVTPAGSVTGVSNATDVTVTKLEQTLVNNTTSTATVVYAISANKDGCPGVPTNVTITVLPRIDLIVTSPATVCSPSTVDLTAAAITAGSTAGLDYTYWTDAAATNSLSNPTTAGNGTFYIKGTRNTTNPNNTCYEIKPVTVTVAPTPTLVINQPSPVCTPGTVNLATTIGAGTTPGLTYTYWSDAGATTTPYTTPATAGDGTYYIKGTTADGCSVIEQVTVKVYTDVQTPVFDDGNSSGICQGASPRTYTAKATNSTGLTYSIDAASLAAGNSVNSATGQITFAANFTGTIILTVTATGCTLPTSAIHTITVNAPPTVTLTGSPLIVCEGSGVTLTATSLAPNSIQTFTGTATPNIAIPNNNTALNSTITLTDLNGLKISATDKFTVTINITHTYDSDLDIHLVDPSGNIMELSTDNGGNGNDYTGTVFQNEDTSKPNITSGTVPFNNTFQPEGSISSLVGGNINGAWRLRIYDDDATHGSDPTNSGTLLDWSLEIKKQISVGSFTTVFNGNGASGNSIINTGSAIQTVYPSAGTHTYSATTTDANGCVATSNIVTVTVNETPKASIAANYCAGGGLIRLTAQGGMAGATYLWSTGATSSYIDVDEVKIYSVTITNPNGCSDNTFLDVSNELVTNGTFTAGRSDFISGYTYYADNPSVNNELVPDSGTDGYGVGTSGQYYHNNFWGFDHTNNTTGNRNFMLVNGHGNTITIWQQTVNVVPNTNYYFSAWAMSLNTAGNYARLQFEVNGVKVGSEAILGPGPGNATQAAANNYWTRFYSDPKWNSGSLSGPITIRIVNNVNFASGNDFGIDDISFGTLDPLPLEIEVNVADACEGGTIQLNSNITGGLEPIKYKWTGPNGFVSHAKDTVITNVTKANHEGIYHLEATDGYGCSVTPDEQFVTVSAAPTVSAGPDQTGCTANPVVTLSGSVTAPATSGTWSNNGGDGVFANVNALNTTYTLGPNEVLAGVANLTLTSDDPAGPCGSAVDNLIVTIFNSLEITASTVTPLCYDGADGTATAAISKGSTPPYSYLWSNGQTTATATGLSAGTYTVTVTDANGCTASTTVEVTQPAPFFIDVIPHITPLTCYGANDGAASIIATGGTQPHSFIWSGVPGNPTTATVTGLAPGVYNVFVSDANGCTATNIQVVIPMPDPPILTCPPNATDFISGNGCNMQVGTIQNPVIANFCTYTLSYKLTGATTGTNTGTVNNLFFNTGITYVEYTVTDVSGNTMSCTFEVWIKNIDTPRFTVTCPAIPNKDIVVPAESGLCDAEVTVPAPVIDNFCNEVFTITYNGTAVSTTLPLQPVIDRFTVGVHPIQWIITDASGTPYICDQTVEVTDANSALDCPVDIERPVDPGEDFATLVQTGDPTVSGNCENPKLKWELVPPAAFASEYDIAELSGGGIYPTNGTFFLGVTTITYSLVDAVGNVVIDSDGDPIRCSFTVTVTDIPIIDCPDNEVFNADQNCEYPFNPGVPALTQGSQPLNWTWKMYYPDAITEIANGGSSTTTANPDPLPIVAAAPHEYDFQLGVTTITWTATDLVGNTATCTQTVTVEDKEDPTFTPKSLTACVDMLQSATYTTGTPNPNVGVDPNLIKNPSPDYYTFNVGNTSLDLTDVLDNCCSPIDPNDPTDPEYLTINWQIDFAIVPDPLNPPAMLPQYPSISGTGQPSTYKDPITGLSADIYLWGDGVNFTVVQHQITYWVEDCHGNKSDPQFGLINITPRPKIIKMN